MVWAHNCAGGRVNPHGCYRPPGPASDASAFSSNAGVRRAQMPAILLIGALLLGGRVYLRYWRRQQLARQTRRADTHRWEDDGGAQPTAEEQSGL